ncbi:MAG: hypothetical protein GF364_18010 [Candidatus Lokiarchaeota archaeon]|nr:hypothetical protein [Candidatus Lokiarchaeota archaeon]
MCMLCGNTQIEFTCPKCGNAFCEDHVINTEEFICKKHNIQYSPKIARVFNYKCALITHVQCPKCGTKDQLILDYTKGGDFFIKCLDPSCSYSSLTHSPLWHSKKISNIGEIIHSFDRDAKCCNRSLTNKKGKHICPHCMASYLRSHEYTSFESIQSIFDIPAEKVKSVLTYLGQIDLIHGTVRGGRFERQQIPEEFYQSAITEIKNKGFICLIDFIENWKKGQNARRLPDKLKLKSIVQNIKEHLTAEKYYVYAGCDTTCLYLEDFARKKIVNILKSERYVDHSIADLGEMLHLFEIDVLTIINKYNRDHFFILITDPESSQVFALLRHEFETMLTNLCKQSDYLDFMKLCKTMSVAPQELKLIFYKLIQADKIRGKFEQDVFIPEPREGQQRQKGKFHPKDDLSVGKDRLSLGKDDSSFDKSLHIKRSFDHVGGQIRLKIALNNISLITLHDIQTYVDVPDQMAIHTGEQVQKISALKPSNSLGVEYYLEPQQCGSFTIEGTVIFKDPYNNTHVVNMEPLLIPIKCPLMKKSDIMELDDLYRESEQMQSNSRIFYTEQYNVVSFQVAIKTVQKFDVRTIIEQEDDNDREVAWFYTRDKIDRALIIIRCKREFDRITFTVYCRDPVKITGFLSKIAELFSLESASLQALNSLKKQQMLDILTITEKLVTASDACALNYTIESILNPLQDAFHRLKRLFHISDESQYSILQKWIRNLKQYSPSKKIGMIGETMPAQIMADIEYIQNTIRRDLLNLV